MILCPLGRLLFLVTLGFASATFSDADAPVIFHSTETASPGDVIALQGDNFGSAPQVWMEHVTGTESSLAPVTQLPTLNSTGSTVSATIPVSETVGLYAVWVVAGGTQAGPVLVNQARSWGAPDLAGTSIDPGRSFRLVGRNLYLPGSSPTVTFISGSTSLPATVTTAGSDSYHLAVTAPSGIATGTTYTVQVSNGFGGSYGQTFLASDAMMDAPGTATPPALQLTGQASNDPLNLGVPWGSRFAAIAADSYNILTDTRLPYNLTLTSGSVTDTNNYIEQDIFWISQSGRSGILYFPAGTYYIVNNNYSRGLLLLPNVVLGGAGASSTHIVMGDSASGFNSYGDSAMCGPTGGSLMGVMNIDFSNPIPSNAYPAFPYRTIEFEGCSYVFATGCTFESGGSSMPLIWQNCQYSVIKNCTINASPTSGFVTAWQNQDMIFSNNTGSYYYGLVSLINTARTVAENNTFTRVYTSSSGWETHGFDISQTQQLVLLNNTINKSGTTAFAFNNDGETILSQGGAGGTFLQGTASSATSTSLTDSSQSWGTNDFSQPSGGNLLSQLPGQALYVSIVNGKGTGQIRKVTANTSNTLTVDHAWSETPDSESIYVLQALQNNRNLVEGNQLSQNMVGIQYSYASLLDVAIANNVLNDNGGITITPCCNAQTNGGAPPLTNSVMETVVVGNQVTQDNSDPYSQYNAYPYISLVSLVQYGGCTSAYLPEFRNNTLIVPTDNPVQGSGNGGYQLMAVNIGGGAPDGHSADQANVGGIFQGNSVSNANVAYQLDTGDIDPVIWDERDANLTTGALSDVTGSGASNASINPIEGFNLTSGYNSTSDVVTNVWAYGTYDDLADPTTFYIPDTLYSASGSGVQLWVFPPSWESTDPNVEKNLSLSPVLAYGIDFEPGRVSFGPYAGPAVARFTAPTAGHYHLAGNFQTDQIRGVTSDGTTAYVNVGDTNEFTQALSDPGLTQFGTAENYAADDVYLSKGETVDFVVGNGAFTTQVDASAIRTGP